MNFSNCSYLISSVRYKQAVTVSSALKNKTKENMYKVASFLFVLGSVLSKTKATAVPLADPRYPLLGLPCTNGEFTCESNVVYQCNLGSWIYNNDCLSAGLVCSPDYECVPPSDNTCPVTVTKLITKTITGGTVTEIKTKTLTEGTATVTKTITGTGTCTHHHKTKTHTEEPCTETSVLGGPEPTPTPELCTVGVLQCLEGKIIQQCAWGFGEVPEWRTLADCSVQGLGCTPDLFVCH